MNTLSLIACAIGAIGGVILYVGIRLGMAMRMGGAANEPVTTYDIHHVDGDPRNNATNNLVLVRRGNGRLANGGAANEDSGEGGRQ